jgi:DNA-binding winged helix-turn-helix (wHTH) protein
MDALQQVGVNRPLERGFRLEALEIDPLDGLVSGPGGHERLDPKVMAVLMLMTRHTGRIVSRDELLARLWPNMVVTDDAVTRCFCVLRRQPSQAGGDRRYRTLIETLPKRGYRFNGEIASLQPPPVVGPNRTGRRRGLAIMIATGAAIALFVFVGKWLVESTAESQAQPTAPAPNAVAVMPAT